MCPRIVRHDAEPGPFKIPPRRISTEGAPFLDRRAMGKIAVRYRNGFKMSFRHCPLNLAIVLAVFPSGLCADDLSKRKSGLWEITESTTDANVAAGTVLVCIDETTEHLLDNINMITSKGKCSEKQAQADSNISTVVATCEVRNSRLEISSVITITDETAYHIEATTLYEPPFLGLGQATRVQDGKRKGAHAPPT